MSDQPNPPLRFALANAHRTDSLTARLDDADLRAAFLGLTKHLPHGRCSLADRKSAFDNAGRDECPVPPKGQELRDVLQAVALAAAESGEESVMVATKLEARRYLDLILDQSFSDAPDAETVPFTCATVTAVKEVSEAVTAMTQAVGTRNPSDLKQAVREVQEALPALEAFRRSSAAVIHTRRVPFNVSRL